MSETLEDFTSQGDRLVSVGQIDFPFTNGAAQIRLLAEVRELEILTG